MAHATALPILPLLVVVVVRLRRGDASIESVLRRARGGHLIAKTHLPKVVSILLVLDGPEILFAFLGNQLSIKDFRSFDL